MFSSSAKNKADHLQSNLRWLKSQLEKYREKESINTKKYKQNLKDKDKELDEFKSYIHQLKREERFIDYCEKAFSRDGLPAFINAQMQPIINKSAEYYSELFCDKEIMVRCEVEDGDLVPNILNTHGGKSIGDQSTGESAMAGIITSFALKDIAPKTNVLILDEPTDGLSPTNIKRFARGLQEIKKRFESIFVVSHSPILLSELSHEKVIKIVKENRIS